MKFLPVIQESKRSRSSILTEVDNDPSHAKPANSGGLRGGCAPSGLGKFLPTAFEGLFSSLTMKLGREEFAVIES